MKSTYALVGGNIFTGDKLVMDKALIIKEGKVVDIVDPSIVHSFTVDIVQVDNCIVSPAFVDLQINGCGGVLFNDDISLHTLEIMKNTNLQLGCTSFLPTLITTTEENVKKAVKITATAHKEDPLAIIGIHIEGPYISKLKKGIHNSQYITSLSIDMVNFLCEMNKEVPIMITVAPEENALPLIAQLVMSGVRVSLGHSNASYEQAIAGINVGIGFATHLYNAMSSFESRNPGVVGAVLNTDIYASIIIDGFHVDYNAIKIAKKLKQDKLFIVTDAVTPMGTTMQQFQLADQTIYANDGKCVNKEGTLAGANIDMLTSVKNAILHVGLSIQDALQMASLIPAKVMGLDFKIGRILPEYEANLVIFDSQFRLKYTINKGKLIKSSYSIW